MTWFLKRLPLIWFLLTLTTVCAALRSVYESGGFR
jgi:hypothetical protein